MGLDIKLSLPEPFTINNTVPIDLELSFFECCGNGFHDQEFISGAITLINDSLLGDVNLDGLVNLLDVAPFVELVSSGEFQFEADINGDGVVNLLDVAPLVELLSGN